MPRRAPLLRILSLAVAATGSAAAQVQWEKLALEGRIDPGFAFDSARGVTVAQGSSYAPHARDTWEWNGASWTRRQLTTAPSRLLAARMAFDSARARVVLFGTDTLATPGVAETWEYDGATWTRRMGTQPPPRLSHGFAYDSVRGRCVLFGGMDTNNVPLGDTWEWDGSQWRQRSPAVQPPARSDHSTTFDPVRGDVLVFGGRGPSMRSDFWAWDGTNWRAVPTATPLSPSARSGASFAFDTGRGRAVLFGGADGSGNFLSDTWEWDGTSWIATAPAQRPRPRAWSGTTYDSAAGHTLLFGGGATGITALSDVWAWDGLTWRELAPTGPPGRDGDVLVFDLASGRTLLWSGYGEPEPMWAWDGTAWTALAAPSGPSWRRGTALVTDVWRVKVLLFGGTQHADSAILDDTWEWNGGTWNHLPLTTAPPARTAHALSFDLHRGRTVLFGGLSAAGAALGDTWEFDGAQWSQRFPPVSPGARHSHRMAFDARRARTVLYGGAGRTHDAWEYDGTTWVEVVQPVPPALLAANLVYDLARERCVLVGRDRVADEMQTWDWDGAVWSRRTVAEHPPDRPNPGLCYDPLRARTVMFGGSNWYGATYELGPSHPASVAPYGSGCAGSVGVPTLTPRRPPWIGEGFALEVTNVPAQPGALMFGASMTVWQGVALPFALDVIGMPGCALLADPVVLLPFFAAAGSATVMFPIPNDVRLLGSAVFAQALIIDPPANPAGATLSHGAQIVVGGR